MYLGIETSCDDTGIAVLDHRNIIFNERITQNHTQYGGVYPTHAVSSHIINLPLLLRKIDINILHAITHIAVTVGPGLKQSLLAGISFAYGLSLNYKYNIIPVHHIEGHILTIGLSDGIYPPYTALVVSGGHTLIVDVIEVGKYRIIGQTLDDALGECFDKVGRYIGLEYPAGPQLEQYALTGDPNRFTLPKPMYYSKCHNMSFAGLKTFVLNHKHEYIEHINDFAASFHKTIIDILIRKLRYIQHKLVICGGVSANKIIYDGLSKHFDTYVSPVNLCTDNGAMIAWAGYNSSHRNIDISVKPRWSIENIA